MIALLIGAFVVAYSQVAFAAVTPFVLTVALVPIVRAFCIRKGILDTPGPLKIHARPVARLGGVAIVIAIAAGALLSGPHRAIAAWPFFTALTLVWAAGFADDLRGISPVWRLAAQFTAGLFLWRAGWRIPGLGNGVFGAAVDCVLVAALANAINLLDGMDGIAAGIAGIVAACFLALPGQLVSAFALAVGVSTAASCAGFLLFNWPPARIFLGDSGSTALGFCLAFLSLDLYRLQPASTPVLVFPLLAAAVPLLDAVLAAVRRLGSRSSPFQGDRSHLYDLLASRGWSVRAIAFALYAVTAVFCAIGLLLVRGSPSRALWLAASIAVGLFLLGAIRLGSLRGTNWGSPSQPADDRLARERLT